jgi:hypothetical protein
MCSWGWTSDLTPIGFDSDKQRNTLVTSTDLPRDCQMPITIHADPPLAPKSEMCLNVVRQALTDARPAGEAWVVRIVGIDQEMTRFEFRRGTDAPRSLCLVLQDDDTSPSLVYASVCRFLRREWPGALTAH